MAEEIQTAIRIVEVLTQTGLQIFRLGRDCSLSALKRMKDIEHARILSEAGQMTYEQLINHVGTDTVILNFHTEDVDEIAAIKQGMKDYKVSFVALPDMAAGDGYTQFMIDASDAAKMNAYLKSHPDVSFEPISVNEYTGMGTEKDWKDIHEKAAENMKQEENRNQDKSVDKEAKTEQKTESLNVTDDMEQNHIPEDIIYRDALIKEGAQELYLPNEFHVAEMENTHLFYLADQNQYVAIPADYVKQDGEDYLAAIQADMPFRSFMKTAEHLSEETGAKVAEESQYSMAPTVYGTDLIHRMLRQTEERNKRLREAAKELTRDLVNIPVLRR